jgi:chemotaxis protein MotA
MKPDLATIIGLVLGVAAILVGNHLEGGHLSSIMQPTAALIVFGGTFGAVMISFPLPVCIRAVKSMISIAMDRGGDSAKLIDEIVGFAAKARKEGIITLEEDAKTASDELLRRGVQMVVDGLDSNQIRESLELEMNILDEEGEQPAKVYEAAGGYSPTIGIIGAVLGLIHVMSNLSDVAKVGDGIAVAFVATIYGVAGANIFFLPAANKLKMKHKAEMLRREMIVDGALAIQEGKNPQLIRDRLSTYLDEKARAAASREAEAA